MRAGTLRHIGIVERRSTSQDAAGQPVDTWATLATVRCSVAHKTGREVDQPSGEVARMMTEIRMRYQSALADLSTEDRIVIDSVNYDIQSVNNMHERNREIVVLAHAE